MLFPSLLELSDIGLFLLRLAVGVVFIYHAFPKLKNAKGMASAMGMPAGMIFMLGAVEFLSGLGLIIGIFVQLAALLLALIMIGAIFMKISKWGIPFAAQDKTGWEFDFVLLIVSIAILFTGGGL